MAAEARCSWWLFRPQATTYYPSHGMGHPFLLFLQRTSQDLNSTSILNSCLPAWMLKDSVTKNYYLSHQAHEKMLNALTADEGLSPRKILSVYTKCLPLCGSWKGGSSSNDLCAAQVHRNTRIWIAATGFRPDLHTVHDSVNSMVNCDFPNLYCSASSSAPRYHIQSPL